MTLLKSAYSITFTLCIALIIFIACITTCPTEKKYKNLLKENRNLKNIINSTLANEKAIKKKILKDRIDVETMCIKKYIASKTTNLDDKTISKVAKAIVKCAIEYEYPFSVIVGLASTESNFDPAAISDKGARGVLQVMFNIWKDELDIANRRKLHDPYYGIKYGINVLDLYMDIHNNDLISSLHAYNSKKAAKYTFADKVCRNICDYLIFRSSITKEINDTI